MEFRALALAGDCWVSISHSAHYLQRWVLRQIGVISYISNQQRKRSLIMRYLAFWTILRRRSDTGQHERVCGRRGRSGCRSDRRRGGGRSARARRPSAHDGHGCPVGRPIVTHQSDFYQIRPRRPLAKHQGVAILGLIVRRAGSAASELRLPVKVLRLPARLARQRHQFPMATEMRKRTPRSARPRTLEASSAPVEMAELRAPPIAEQSEPLQIQVRSSALVQTAEPRAVRMSGTIGTPANTGSQSPERTM